MNRFAAIHQFHAGTAQGDAITQQMLHLRDQISQMGVPSEIFAEYVADGLQDRIQPIGSYRGIRAEPVCSSITRSATPSSTTSSDAR